MKQIYLFCAIACTMGFYACTKDGTTTTVTNTVRDTTTINYRVSGLINADSLTAGITVGYGTSVADSVLPASSTDAAAPVLDSFSFREYTAFRGGYLTIYPGNVSGRVEGYYVQIVGAHTYFNVDYPYVEIAPPRKTNTPPNVNARGNGEGYIDSAIVIKLPANISGDTFYVRYAAYDAENRVSNVITSSVYVVPANTTSATLDSLQGDWKMTGRNSYYLGSYSSDDWVVEVPGYYNYQFYDCVDDQLVYTGNSNSLYYVGSRQYLYSWDMTISGNLVTSLNGYTESYLDISNSSCANRVYIQDYAPDVYDGGYTYNAAARKITVITAGRGTNLSLSYNTYTIMSLTATEMILARNNQNDYPGMNVYRFTKQ